MFLVPCMQSINLIMLIAEPTVCFYAEHPRVVLMIF